MAPENQPWSTGRHTRVCTDILRVPLCLAVEPALAQTSPLDALPKYTQAERVRAGRNQKARSEKDSCVCEAESSVGSLRPTGMTNLPAL